VFSPRDTRHKHGLCGGKMSVRLSVTRRYCVETAKPEVEAAYPQSMSLLDGGPQNHKLNQSINKFRHAAVNQVNI